MVIAIRYFLNKINVSPLLFFMTRIITEKYKCANCGNELYRKQVASSSSFFHSEDIFSCAGTFTGISPKLYFCDQCGYIGEDLSKNINPEHKEIINSGEYKLFLEIGDKYNPDFLHFLLGYTLMKFSRYKEAIPHYISSINGGSKIFLKEETILDKLLLLKDIELEMVFDNSMDPGNLFVNYLITECAKNIDYQKVDSFLLFYESIDALRRLGHLKEAIKLIELAMNNNYSEEQKALIKNEQELCTNSDILTIVKITDEDEYH